MITVTITATASGRLGSTDYTNALVTVTAVYDPADVGVADGIYRASATATIAIAGISGTATFTSDEHPRIFCNQYGPGAGIGADLDVLDVMHSAFASYDLGGAIGPITGPPRFNHAQLIKPFAHEPPTSADGGFPTDKGLLLIDSVNGSATFTAA